MGGPAGLERAFLCSNSRPGFSPRFFLRSGNVASLPRGSILISTFLGGPGWRAARQVLGTLEGMRSGQSEEDEPRLGGLRAFLFWDQPSGMDPGPRIWGHSCLQLGSPAQTPKWAFGWWLVAQEPREQPSQLGQAAGYLVQPDKGQGLRFSGCLEGDSSPPQPHLQAPASLQRTCTVHSRGAPPKRGARAAEPGEAGGLH